MRRGVTLVELLVVLAILGVMAGISGVALASLRAPRESARVRTLNEARAQAIRSGKPVQVLLDTVPPRTGQQARPLIALFLPDGRAIGLGLDPLTGAPDGQR